MVKPELKFDTLKIIRRRAVAPISFIDWYGRINSDVRMQRANEIRNEARRAKAVYHRPVVSKKHSSRFRCRDLDCCPKLNVEVK